jgi:hypothetical protein
MAKMNQRKANRFISSMISEIAETRCISSRGKSNPRGIKKKMSCYRVRRREEPLNIIANIKPDILQTPQLRVMRAKRMKIAQAP